MQNDSLVMVFSYGLSALLLIIFAAAGVAIYMFVKRPTDQEKMVEALNYYQKGDWYFDSTTNTYRDRMSTRFHRASEFEGVTHE